MCLSSFRKKGNRRRPSVWVLVFALVLMTVWTLAVPVSATNAAMDIGEAISEMGDGMSEAASDVADGIGEAVSDIGDSAEDGKVSEDTNGIIEKDTDEKSGMSADKKAGWIALAIALVVVIAAIILIIVIVPKKKDK